MPTFAQLAKGWIKATAKPVLGRSYEQAIRRGLVQRPHYGYIVYRAADLARRLGEPRISILEFGVAGGNGLINLEMHAAAVERETGVSIDVYGFDTGEGLPPPENHKDLPFIWQANQFKMDVPALRSRLTRARLVLGNVNETATTFGQQNPAPVGAISFDLDYYSSTRDAFRIFDLPAAARLPRVFCYFDDLMSSDLGHIMQGNGVPLAIAEFNAQETGRQLGALNHLEFAYGPRRKWHGQVYVAHDFNHSKYASYIVGGDRQLPLGG